MNEAVVGALPESPDRRLIVAAYAGYVFLGANGILFSALIRAMERDFHQTDAGFGLLYLLRGLAFAGGALLGGLLTERFGRKAVLTGGAALGVAGLVITALTSVWFILIGGSVVAGLGLAAIDAGTNALVLDLYHDARASALNLLHLFFGAGALFGPLFVGVGVSVGLGWRFIVLVNAVLLAGLLVALAALPMPHGRRRQTGQGRQGGRSGRVRLFVWLAAAIALYAAAEMGVSSWVVRLLSAQSLISATGTLSLFWGGLAGGRLLSAWFAERFDYASFAAGCMVFASAALVSAVIAPWPLSVPLYTLAGLLYGPVYPMIMALAGRLYPGRLAAVSGTLTTAAEIGIIVYPAFMGLAASRIGLGVGMIGAAALGIVCAATILVARSAARRPSSV